MKGSGARVRSVAMAFAVITENELAFLEGFRAASPGGREWEVWILTGGYEAGLRRLAETNQLSAAIGDFVSAQWTQALLERKVKVIQLANSCYLEAAFNICPDYARVGEEAARILYGNGCISLAFIGIPGHFASACCGEGFARVAKGLSLDVALHTATSPMLIADFVRHLKYPSGVLAASDRLARMVVEAAKSQGLKIPGDVAVMGIGNRRLESLQAGIPISSFELPGYDLGKQAAQLLRRLFKEEKTEVCLPLLAARLYERESSLRGTRGGVERAIAYMQSHLDTSLGVENLSRLAGMSRRSFEMAMRREYQISPARLIQQLRMQRAKELLADRRLTVSEVGRACGYPEPSVFCVAFRRWSGFSAGVFRDTQCVSQTDDQ